MAITINADTSNGLVMTPDTSGQIKLQAGGADIATVSSTGITMAAGKTLPAASLTGTAPFGVMPAGSILQVKNVVKTNVQSFSNAVPTWADISGLNISITPSSTSSKILVMYSVHVANGGDQGHGYIKVLRGATDLPIADVVGSRTSASSVVNTGHVGQTLCVSQSLLDSPSSTTALTYKLQFGINGAGVANWVNQSTRDSNATGNDGRMISTMTVMEVAG